MIPNNGVMKTVVEPTVILQQNRSKGRCADSHLKFPKIWKRPFVLKMYAKTCAGMNGTKDVTSFLKPHILGNYNQTS
jgi:hypothetical protein